MQATQKLLSEHEKEKASGHFPSLAEIKKIRKAFADLEKATIQLDASRISLEITPARALSGRIDAGDDQGPLTLEAGKPTALHGAPEIRLEIESFGVLRAFGPCSADLPSLSLAHSRAIAMYPDTQLLIESTGLDEDAIFDYIQDNIVGDSLLAVGDDELIKIHYHTNEPWQVLEYCATLGDIYDIVVENMQRQSDGLQG